ncbi:ribonuclease HII [Candidatus Saccharibacteria bacterium]|nr:ribonuclease HII [Candidatus Saccharibacteria bacterium]
MAILGVDEVGRGPLAGPLVIGAVILSDPTADWCTELNDSKKLTPKKREKLSEIILKNADAATLGWVSSAELDKIGMTAALRLATRRAVTEIKNTHTPFSEIIIDGNINFLSGTSLEPYTSTLIKGDQKIKAISAASIIAKVARDRYMVELAEKYPGYGFEKHMGYGTALHRAALEKLGPCPEHRTSFSPIKELKNTTKTGGRAESIVASFLESSGHEIIARNHKTKFYEIDIISTKDDKIYFTEVKYRKSAFHGSGLDAITPKKREQMTFAAEAFLKFRPDLAENFSPLLAVAAVSGEGFTLDAWFPLED